jgi:uncharacterized protein YdeI (YjbR/CyaY-like superfamily)
MAITQETLCFENRSQWRSWLFENCRRSRGVWLIFYKKSYRKIHGENLVYLDARDEALCFGWIDSSVKNIDNEKMKQYFSPRKPKGFWSKFNRSRIQWLMEQNLMTEFGLEIIEKAKASGFYYMLNQVEDLLVPEELAEVFRTGVEIKNIYDNLSKSQKKRILYSLLILKTAVARKRKIESIVQNLLESSAPSGEELS